MLSLFFVSFKTSLITLALSLHSAYADTWQLTFWEQISGTADRTMVLQKVTGFVHVLLVPCEVFC